MEILTRIFLVGLALAGAFFIGNTFLAERAWTIAFVAQGHTIYWMYIGLAVVAIVGFSAFGK